MNMMNEIKQIIEKGLEGNRLRDLYIKEYKEAKWFDSHRTYIGKEFENLLSDILSIVNIEKESYANSARAILINIIYSYFYFDNKYIILSLDSKYYKKSRYINESITYTPIKICSALLKDYGFIDIVKGRYDHKTNIGYVTRITYTDKMIDYINKYRITPDMVTTSILSEVIILRDENKNNIEYKDTVKTHRMRDFLTKYNAFMDTVDISLDRETGEPVDFKQVKLYRVFSETFSKGGRFYGPFYQIIKREYRKHILINGSPTVERDFSTLHVNFLYQKEDKKSPGKDAYTVPGSKFPPSGKMRTLCKKVLNLLFNCKNESLALEEFRKEAIQEGYKYPFPLPDLSEVARELKEYHAPIAEYFCSGKWGMLQWWDSQIAEKVLKVMLKRKIPTLPVQDSFIVREEDKETLESVMKGVYQDVIGRMVGHWVPKPGITFK